MSDHICIYHGNCADGFGAAWAVWKRFKDWEFYAGVHQQPPPDVSGRDVVIVDFSYKRPVLEEMAQAANTILILDHHKSAADDLEGLPPPLEGPYNPAAMEQWQRECNAPAAVHALFDMDRSGAGIAWDYFHGGPRPALINHIEDRDLWKFDLPKTREILAALFSYPYEFELWDGIIDEFEGDMLGAHSHDSPASRLSMEGEAIERKHHKDIYELVAVTQRDMNIAGYIIPVASLPYTLASDAGHMMAQDKPFAGCYWDTPDGRTFSLRSTAHGIDVSQIATEFGGGGHRNAAGFSVPRDHPLARL